MREMYSVKLTARWVPRHLTQDMQQTQDGRAFGTVAGRSFFHCSWYVKKHGLLFWMLPQKRVEFR